MKTKTPPVILVLLRFIVLVIALVCLFRLGSWLLGPSRLAGPIASQEWLAGLPALLAVCTLDTLILCFLIWRSRLSGWRLLLTTGLIFYSVKTFIPQLDLIYFYRSMPTITKTMLPGILLMSLPMAVFFPPIAVALASRWKKTGEEAAHAHLRPAAFLNWLWKAALLAVVVYPLLFALFGYFVAWQNPALRAYYGATQTGSFFNTGFFGGDLSLYPFEVLRGLLWVCVVTTVVSTGRGKWWERALLTAFLLALVMNDVHLLPNPLMPASVRLSHFAETTTSNFIFGFAASALLQSAPKPHALKPVLNPAAQGGLESS